jgi:hypothetical protein
MHEASNGRSLGRHSGTLAQLSVPPMRVMKQWPTICFAVAVFASATAAVSRPVRLRLSPFSTAGFLA